MWTILNIEFKRKRMQLLFYNTFTNHKTLKLDNKTRQSHHLSSKKFLRVAKNEKRNLKFFKTLMYKAMYTWFFFCNRTFQCGQRNLVPNIESNLLLITKTFPWQLLIFNARILSHWKGIIVTLYQKLHYVASCRKKNIIKEEWEK